MGVSGRDRIGGRTGRSIKVAVCVDVVVGTCRWVVACAVVVLGCSLDVGAFGKKRI